MKKITVTQVLFVFNNEEVEAQIVYIRAKEVKHEPGKNPKNLKWRVLFRAKDKADLYGLGWTDAAPNQTNAAEWLQYFIKNKPQELDL